MFRKSLGDFNVGPPPQDDDLVFTLDLFRQTLRYFNTVRVRGFATLPGFDLFRKSLGYFNTADCWDIRASVLPRLVQEKLGRFQRTSGRCAMTASLNSTCSGKASATSTAHCQITHRQETCIRDVSACLQEKTPSYEKKSAVPASAGTALLLNNSRPGFARCAFPTKGHVELCRNRSVVAYRRSLAPVEGAWCFHP